MSPHHFKLLDAEANENLLPPPPHPLKGEEAKRECGGGENGDGGGDTCLFVNGNVLIPGNKDLIVPMRARHTRDRRASEANDSQDDCLVPFWI